MILTKVTNFLVQEEGATAVEYAVLLTLIVLAIAQAVLALGSSTQSTFQAIADLF